MLWYNLVSGCERMLQTYRIFTYGFNAIEENIMGKMLPDKKSVLVSTDCFTDLIACNSYAILIHATSVADEDFKMLWNYYIEVGANASETVIVVGNTDIPKQIKKRIKVYSGFEELCRELKYILLSAYRSHKKTVNFSATLANTIVILGKIRHCPGITTVQLSEELEISQRSVQRYIATLTAAGEWIEYDRNLKGWKLTNGKSVLWGDW